ncbi:glycosyltransferase [Methylobacterium sp. J-078]|uniref:DUF4214 domain-containing protein n=1 Tax=Methylobacterium sp. J-078 TaxID=2836657 RepID=UPI001FB9BA35|nr:DUF4214 domain-containing protein [Methylobacterium sp. J-078]MCJ2043554.1 glycosyltransferase [Methylobacterium sp. J-078]
MSIDNKTNRYQIVSELYKSILFRVPDQNEIEPHVAFLDQGGDFYELFTSIFYSIEADNVRNSPVHRTSFGPRDFITLLYEAKLGRCPSEQELESWLDSEGNGDKFTSLYDAISRSSEAVIFAKSKDNTNFITCGESSSVHEDMSQAIKNLYVGILKRTPKIDEVSAWAKAIDNGMSIADVISELVHSDEVKINQQTNSLLDFLSDGVFIQNVYEIILGRGISSLELSILEQKIRAHEISRDQIVKNCFLEKYNIEATKAPYNNPNEVTILGSRRTSNLSDWNSRKSNDLEQKFEPNYNCLPLKANINPRVSVIVSMYNGLPYMESFLNNMLSQTIFEECEIIIIDACSPQGEYDSFHHIIEKHKNIKYNRLKSRIGIYEAWNIGIDIATAPYITNANLDDQRHSKSFQIQASILDNIPFVDVVYQDFYYTFEPNIDFRTIARIGIKSHLPIISKNNIMSFNSPHNAPMWRRNIHFDIGMFDASFKSAGDYDFWIRCLNAGKTFYKINDPHVAYYVNPLGLSTSPDTVGVKEANVISKRMNKLITSEYQTMPIEDFIKILSRISGFELDGYSRADQRYNYAQNVISKLSTKLK